jgi:hypothetical protein
VHPGIVANPPVLGGTQNHFAAIVDDLGAYYESMS